MALDRRRFAKSLTGIVGAALAGGPAHASAQAGRAGAAPAVPPATGSTPAVPAAPARAASRLAPTKVTRIRLFYPQNYDRNGPQAFPQSNMVVLVDTEMIWQAAFMDGFYSPGKERLHALGAIDLALWDIKGKALGAPLYQLFGGKAREHIELYATNGLPPGLVAAQDAAAMTLKDRAARTMAAGYRVFRVDSDILPNPGGPAGARRGPAQGATFDSRSHIRLIAEAAAQMREGVGPDGNWMIDLHQKFDFHEAVEVCRALEPHRPFIVEDPLREEQFRTQLPKLRVMTSVPLAPGEEWGTRADFSPLVENRDIDFARVSLPNVGGITEMLKIMAVCDTHRVGIVPHFTGPIATTGHMHTMMAFPGQVLMEFNLGERPVPYLPEFLECRDGKVWSNDRPGLGVTIDERQLTFVEAITEGAPGATQRRLDGSLTHW